MRTFLCRSVCVTGSYVFKLLVALPFGATCRGELVLPLIELYVSCSASNQLKDLVNGDGPSVVMTNGLVKEGVLFLSREAIAFVTNVAEEHVDTLDVNLGGGWRWSNALEQFLLEAVGCFS